jgi:hypothetical protein
MNLTVMQRRWPHGQRPRRMLYVASALIGLALTTSGPDALSGDSTEPTKTAVVPPDCPAIFKDERFQFLAELAFSRQKVNATGFMKKFEDPDPTKQRSFLSSVLSDIVHELDSSEFLQRYPFPKSFPESEERGRFNVTIYEPSYVNPQTLGHCVLPIQRLEAEAQAEEEQARKEADEAARAVREKAEKERIAREQAEFKHLQEEKAEQERLETQELEAARKAGFNSVEEYHAQLEKLHREKEEKERKEAEAKAEEERKVAEERAAQQRQEAERERQEAAAKLIQQRKQIADKGATFARESGTKWELESPKSEMTDKVELTVRSSQDNGKGALATVEGRCAGSESLPNRGVVAVFAATITDDNGQPDIGFPTENALGVWGAWRRNEYAADQGMMILRYKFRNQFIIATIGDTDEGHTIRTDTSWRVMAEIETTKGPVLIKIPIYDEKIQQLLGSCTP